MVNILKAKEYRTSTEYLIVLMYFRHLMKGPKKHCLERVRFGRLGVDINIQHAIQDDHKLKKKLHNYNANRN